MNRKFRCALDCFEADSKPFVFVKESDRCTLNAGVHGQTMNALGVETFEHRAILLCE